MAKQDDLYEEASASFGPALARLARGYEADPEKRRDLLQEIHVALWRSLAGFDGRCSHRTWVYRVAHNRAVSHVRWHRANTPILLSLDELEAAPESRNGEFAVDREKSLQRLLELIQRLQPLDRQVMLLHLEGLDAASIGEIAGITSANVHTKVHRLKKILTERFHQGGRDAE